MKEVKRFVKEPGHADSYEGLVIDFKPGKKPHLIIEDDAGEELERIDLAPLSTGEIHELRRSKGGVPRGPDAGAAEELAAQAEAVADAEATL